MNKEEYYKRLEKTTEKIKNDRCSEDEIANINRQKLYLAEHYISNLEEENQKYKEVIDKVINNSQYWIDYYTKLNSDKRIALRLQENIDILKEVE